MGLLANWQHLSTFDIERTQLSYRNLCIYLVPFSRHSESLI